MASRTAKIASSIIAGILAGAPLTAPRSSANAAECITEPGKDGTLGQHWHYRIEHGTKRHCWYLRDENGRAVEGAPSDDSAQAPNTATQNSENPRPLEDARAEYPMPQVRDNTVAPVPAPSPAPLAASPVPALPQADAQGSAVAARWPSPETATAPAAAAAAMPAPVAPPAAVDPTDSAPATNAAADASSDAPASAPAAGNVAPARPSVSLQMLFAVIGGALALAGLTASVVYRLGRRKERRLATPERRAVLWEGVESGPRPPWVPPDIEEETAPLPIPKRRTAQSPRAQERHQKIEELLAQLVQQGQQSDA
jgi:hypothetical protein